MTDSSDNHGGNADCETEEIWDLPQDFNLFSKHEVRTIYFPPPIVTTINNDEHEQEHSARSRSHSRSGRHCDSFSFQIESLEPSSPLDITNKSESDAEKYDATGHCVWTGAFLLIQCMDDILQTVDVKNKRIVELGCGTGIGGLSMTFAPSSSTSTCNSTDAITRPQMVCYTDADPAALEVCRRNCELNGLESSRDYTIRELTWGEDNDIFDKSSEQVHDDAHDDAHVLVPFDLALATDVLYEVDLCGPLFTTVSQCIPVDATFILSHVPRACYNEGNPPEAIEDLDQYIINQAEEHGLRLERTILPPDPDDIHEDLLSWCSKDSFLGSSVLIFRKFTV